MIRTATALRCAAFFFSVLCAASTLAAQSASKNAGIPAVKNVVARQSEGPLSTKGIPGAAQSTQTTFAKASYVIEANKLKLDVYVTKDPKSITLGPSNLDCVSSAGSDVSKNEYGIVGGKPVYSITRSDGTWFVFVCPDQVFDLCGFFRNFLTDYAFFETRLPGAAPMDLLPAIVGAYF